MNAYIGGIYRENQEIPFEIVLDVHTRSITASLGCTYKINNSPYTCIIVL